MNVVEEKKDRKIERRGSRKEKVETKEVASPYFSIKKQKRE